MSTPDTTSSFIKFTLSEHEQLMGSILTYEQKMFIQTKVADIAEQLLAFKLDANNYSATVQQHAYLSGQIDSLRHLLDCSIASEQALVDLAANSQ